MVMQEIGEAAVLILNSKVKVDQEMIDQAIRLKLVIRAGVGTDHIDGDYLASQNIQLRNCAGSNADAVAEQTVAMLLVIRNHLLRADQEVRQFTWRRAENRGHELTGKTVGIIGYGNTGSQVAKRLSSFGCRILAYDKYKSGFANAYTEEVALAQIFAEAEVLSLHVPLTAETRAWVDHDFLQKFHHPIYLLNLARGPIVKIEDLLEALDSGRVIAAALDVLPNENMHLLSEAEKSLYSTLFNRANVMLSPHIGGWTFESLQNIDDMIIASVKELLG
jgi:D-3-phosphoglycerate dehydrogenase